jgi:hypothetical protein
MYHRVLENGVPVKMTIMAEVEHPVHGTFPFRWHVVGNRMTQLENAPNAQAKNALLQAMMQKEINRRVQEMAERPTVTTDTPADLDETISLPD